ncbi:sensor histidine kinase [Sphingobacterium hungaricum]|uniref:histidine kinase n=1 Tax=Sphingobacterium hungaricum TaxID=2082723 RepID=A0A928UVP9_9SPHI|nr:ATP-binding protein [Sphingobacterium hungaricum]MBE8714196.1 two-component sensor histidine kinase [Sphingobacterium hungaricum]
MDFKVLLLVISFFIAFAISLVSFVYHQDFITSVIYFAVSIVVSFLSLNYVFEKFINERIRTIYKLIHNLKLGKDLKEALGDHSRSDPITDAEREVRDWAKQKASEIDKLKVQAQFRKEFLSNISHEFKTPLFAIQGYLETLQDGLIDEDTVLAKSFLDKASKNLDRLSYLINDLDEISKLESGRIALNIEKFDIIELIRETIDYLDDKAKANQILLSLKVKNNTPILVKADRKKIQQVLTNLIDNSIKYGKANGKTSISTFQLFDQILVEVTDDGHGIDEKDLNRVFERFYRTDKSRSRDIGGSGLGLSIVKHIMEAHQQNVHVRSTRGIGTTFAFTLNKAK